ncbi:MAG: histidine kinase [Calditrichota bacterium]
MFPGHPLFQKKTTLLTYFTVWVVLAVLQAAVMRLEFGHTWASALTDGFISYGIFSLFAISFWYPAKYLSLEENSTAIILINHLAAAMVAAGIWAALLYLVLPYQMVNPENSDSFLRNSLSWRVAIGMLLYTIVTFFFYLQSYYTSFHEKMLRESELQNLAREAELRSLKLQINPHFIFNSLNSLNALIASDPVAASNMTVKLSQMLRATLATNLRSLRSLEEELETAGFYLDIERERFGDKIRYKQTVAEELLSWPVPAMCLQPLFENAVKHAVYESLEPIEISFQAEQKKDFLVLKLENDVPTGVRSRKGTGVGLQNVRSRLELIYEKENLLTTSRGDNHFSVELIIPNQETES